MNVAIGETYTMKLYPRVENSDYLYSESPSCQFKCRPASQLEKRLYRIQIGVDGGTTSLHVLASNLPAEIKQGDQVEFLGKRMVVASIGYYYDQTRILNASVLNEDAIIKKSPKGLQLQ